MFPAFIPSFCTPDASPFNFGFQDGEPVTNSRSAYDILRENSQAELLRNLILSLLSHGDNSSFLNSNLFSEFLKTIQNHIPHEGSRANFIEFSFQDMSCSLKNTRVEGNCALELQVKTNPNFKYIFKNNSIATLRRHCDLLDVFTKVTSQAKEAFLPLFRISIAKQLR